MLRPILLAFISETRLLSEINLQYSAYTWLFLNRRRTMAVVLSLRIISTFSLKSPGAQIKNEASQAVLLHTKDVFLKKFFLCLYRHYKKIMFRLYN